MDGDEFRPEDFTNGSYILIKYATRKFRQKITWPADFMTVLPQMVLHFVSLCSKTKTEQDVTMYLDELARSNTIDKYFSDSLKEIRLRILETTNKPKYIWELAADLVQFYNVILNYFSQCMKALSTTDDQIVAEIANIPKYQEQLAKTKPEDAEPATEVSLDFTKVENLKTYRGFPQAKCLRLLKCTICEKRAHWYAMPCSHPLCCNRCYEEYGGEELYEDCPDCGTQITEFLRLNE